LLLIHHAEGSARAVHPLVQLHIDRSAFEDLEQRAAKGGPWDDWRLYQLAWEAEENSIVTDFHELHCLKALSSFKPLPHQVETARKVLNEMHGRAILADEVGLGKTIEAGLILKEFWVRGLVRKALVLVPSSLVLQWFRELTQKFDLPVIAQRKQHCWHHDLVIASLDTAKREPNRSILLNEEFDMIIVDEAHKLKNKRTSNYRFVSELRKKYCLLLTATPVQNDLGELYNLVTLLKPGQLGDEGDFQTNFVRGKRLVKNEDKLQENLGELLIRNRRSDGNVSFTKRFVSNVPLTLSAEEMALYRGVTDYIKLHAGAESGNFASMLSLVTLQREVCSSRDAVFVTLVNLFKKTAETSPLRARIWELVELIRQITANTKAEKTMELLQGMNGKAIVFTEYRQTQTYLLRFFQEHGMTAVSYRGGMNRGQKDWMMDLFRNRAQVMVATEAGGEGINLQFCNQIINFDLPWNPMRVEQRIGRVHRLGQTKDVHIYNLCTLGTIEEHILRLLHEKINLFESVIGELDDIVQRMEQDESWERRVARLVLDAASDEELRSRFDRLGEEMIEARKTNAYTRS